MTRVNAEVGTRNAEQKWGRRDSHDFSLLFRLPRSTFRVVGGVAR